MPSLDTEILALLCPAMGSVPYSVPMAFDLHDLYQSMTSLAPLSTQAPGLCSSCQDGAGRGIPYLCLLVCLFTSPSTSMSLCPAAYLLYREEEHRWAAELGGSGFQPRFTTYPHVISPGRLQMLYCARIVCQVSSPCWGSSGEWGKVRALTECTVRKGQTGNKYIFKE